MTSSRTSPGSWSTWAPGLQQLLNYQRGWPRGDVLAGVTVAAYLVPQVMAYATVAGLPAVAGLWAALVPLAVYAVLGSSRQLSVGPESTTALMTATALAPLVAGDPARYAVLAAVMAVLVGGFCLLGGLLRLGFLADLLSRPVLVGYMTGVAVIMIGGQLGKVTGVAVEGDEFVDQVRSFVAGVGGAHWPTVALALVVLVTLLVISRVAPKFPGALVAVLAATAAVVVFALETRGIRVVGEIPAGLPTPSVPVIPAADLLAMLIPAVGIAVVAFSDNALTGRTFAARKGESIDANAELRALGICNVATGLTHGFPVSSSGSRTALGDAVGSRTQVYSLVALGSVVAVMFLGRGLLENFPMAALGALVVFAALRLIDIAEFRRLGRFRRSELLLALATTAAVLGFGVLYGVLVAIGLSILDLLRRVARPHDGVLGLGAGCGGDARSRRLSRRTAGSRTRGLPVRRAAVLRQRRGLPRTRLGGGCGESGGPGAGRSGSCSMPKPTSKWTSPRSTLLTSCAEILTARGIVFAMARVKQDLRELLDAAGMVDKIGENRIFMTLPTAVEAFHDRDPRWEEA